MNPYQILIIDDEPNVRFVLERTLQNEGYLLDTAGSGSEALKKVRKFSYDLILLDLNMKPVDGMQVLNSVRAQDPHIVVIILTAYSTIESAVDAMRLGAFDYLFKPADPVSIRQRVADGIHYRQQILQQQNILRQIEGLKQTLAALESGTWMTDDKFSRGRFLVSNDLMIDKHHRVAALSGNLLDLTTTEFNILSCLVDAAPRPVSAKELLSVALDYDLEESRAAELIKYHIHQLRKKIEEDLDHPTFIKTVRYKGYLWSGV